ncbi:MAG: mucoidy inhibitor MuiA family protein [bacterium]
MRTLVCIFALLPGTAFADTILATSHVTAVTVYPQGAQVTREVSFEAPAGPHEVVITDLPADTEADLLRLSSSDLGLGSFALRSDRMPPQGEVTSPAMDKAKTDVLLAEEVLRAAQAKVDGINAEVEAQEAQIKFLGAIKMNDAAATAEALSSVSQMIGTEVLTARLAALSAEGGLPVAQAAVTKAQEALTAAQDTEAALSQGAEDYAALSVSVTAQGGTGHLVVTHYLYDATWAPVYDMMLTRAGSASLAVNRGVLVSQASGEDWVGVDLTLSTARPSEQAQSSDLYPVLRRVTDPVEDMARAAVSDGMASGGSMEAAPVMAAPEATVAVMGYQGDVVVYHYPTPVDAASGVENLRLALDSLTFAPKVVALAVPSRDQTAFVTANVTNESPEILLPGQAYLYREGTLVGMNQLAALSPGDKVDLGFGAIDGIRLKRDIPERAEGDRGVFTSSTQIVEKAVLQVENLTGDSWPVRVLDQVPYSEQEELEISYTADPAATETDVDGKRGVLAWEFDLAAGEKKDIRLDSVTSWPAGKVLQ